MIELEYVHLDDLGIEPFLIVLEQTQRLFLVGPEQ